MIGKPATGGSERRSLVIDQRLRPLLLLQALALLLGVYANHTTATH